MIVLGITGGHDANWCVVRGGVLLGAFAECGMKVYGVDPAPNIVDKARARGIDTICDFFSLDAVTRIVSEKGQASVVTGTNVFAHVNDLVTMMAAVQFGFA